MMVFHLSSTSAEKHLGDLNSFLQVFCPLNFFPLSFVLEGPCVKPFYSLFLGKDLI